jgi:chaperonin GroES
LSVVYLNSEGYEMTVKIKPLYDRVLVKRLESEQKSAGGIIIPDTAQEKTQLGVVEAVGEGKLLNDGSLRPLTLKVGDKVVFGKYSGTEFKFDSQEYLITREEELLGVILK